MNQELYLAEVLHALEREIGSPVLVAHRTLHSGQNEILFWTEGCQTAVTGLTLEELQAMEEQGENAIEVIRAKLDNARQDLFTRYRVDNLCDVLDDLAGQLGRAATERFPLVDLHFEHGHPEDDGDSFVNVSLVTAKEPVLLMQIYFQATTKEFYVPMDMTLDPPVPVMQIPVQAPILTMESCLQLIQNAVERYQLNMS